MIKIANEKQFYNGEMLGISNITGETRHIKTDEYGNLFNLSSAGVATGGTGTTVVDSTKDFETDILNGKIIKVYIDSKEYFRKITASTANTITFPAIKVGVAATAPITVAETGVITVTNTTTGVAGNANVIKIVEAPGSDDALSASFSNGVITVYLGKTSGVVDDLENTVTLVTAQIDAIPEFTATATGAGVVVVTTEDIPFTGGIDEIIVVSGIKYWVI